MNKMAGSNPEQTEATGAHPASYRECKTWSLSLLGLLLAWAGTVSGLSCASARADGGYQLGSGYDLGPFNFAGYSDVVADVPNQGQKALALEDLSLFVTGHVSKIFNPFMEAELTHLGVIGADQSEDSHGGAAIVLERLYDDAELTDSFTLRLGKMLAPVGEWNQIHAAPLVLTTVRPAVTYRNFSEYLTGPSLLYSDPSGNAPEFQVYWQPDRELSERPSSLTVDQYKMIEGIHSSLPLSLLDKLGFSFQKSRDMRGVDQLLFGLDLHYTVQDLTLQGEATYSDLSGHAPGQIRQTEWGGYVAASYAFADHWSAYSWYEQFADRSAASMSHDVLVGVTYRPQPAIVFKLEYLQNVGGQPVNPTGLFASWSVLF